MSKKRPRVPTTRCAGAMRLARGASRGTVLRTSIPAPRKLCHAPTGSGSKSSQPVGHGGFASTRCASARTAFASTSPRRSAASSSSSSFHSSERSGRAIRSSLWSIESYAIAVRPR